MMKFVLRNTLIPMAVMLIGACSDLRPEPTTSRPSVTRFPVGTATLTIVETPANTIAPAPPQPSALPLFNLTASPMPSPSPTPFEIPIDSLEHPLSIEVMRQQEYPGSSVVIEQILEPGENYNRYYASYLSDGLKIYALLTVPNGEKPDSGWPVIIFNHGYIPPGLYRTTERYVEYVDRLASSGYVVFRSDYRGHGNSDGIARGAYGFPDYTIDVLNAVTSMKSYPDADPNRIGMWAHSMGGYITLRAMVISNDIRVGVIWAGVVASYPDMVNNWNLPAADIPTSESGWRTSLTKTYGTPSQNPAFWDVISANSYLSDLSGPIQLHHGTGDVEVPVAFSTTLYQQLQVARIPAELYTYQYDNHNIANSFDLAMQRTIQYFDIYLKNNPQ